MLIASASSDEIPSEAPVSTARSPNQLDNQSSMMRSGIREKSFVFRVNSLYPHDKAMLAMRRSIVPMRRNGGLNFSKTSLAASSQSRMGHRVETANNLCSRL